MSESVGNREAVEAALERILARSEFVASPRQQAFLRFVVEETLADRGNRLKAFTIATSIFGRNETFDPQKNSIVRVEALRLRRLLDQYYDGPGADDPLHIRLRRGTYVPGFIPKLQARAPEEMESGAEAEAEGGSPERRAATLRARGWLVALGVAGAASAALLVAFFHAPPRTSEGDPSATGASAAPMTRHSTISVGPIRASGSEPATIALADRLTHDIEDKLSLFDNPVVVEAAAVPPLTDYHLSGVALPGQNNAFALSFRMTRRGPGANKEIIWAKRIDNFYAADEGGPRLAAMMTAIAQSYGAIHADIRRRLQQSSTVRTSYDCVVMAYDAFDAPTADNLAEAEGCLEGTIAADATFASGHAALAFLNVERWLDALPEDPDRTRLTAARRFARNAVRLAPSKARMHAAKFWSRFFDGRYEEAFDEARLALQLNPYATDTLARLGAAHVLLGQYDKGEELLDRAAQASSAAPSWQDFFLFLAAYMKGDWPRAAAFAGHSGAGLFPLGMVAQAVAARHRGDVTAAREWRERLTASFPGFAQDLDASFKRWSMRSDIRARLLADLGETNTAAVAR